MLRVRLFGAFALESEGVALPMPERRRACALLGWLALHHGMHPRSEVAGRFWPDVLDSSARKSLRTELVAVRRALGAAGEGVLVATRDTVGLVGDGVCVDAREFARLVREGRLEEAVDLCDGELLPGLDAEWVYEAREAHRRRLGDVLGRLASDAEAAGALKDAIRISRRGVELDPLREDAHREHIRRLIAAGEVAAARLAFDGLARRLRTELHVAPSRETRRLLEAIHAHAGDPAAAATEPLPPLPPALARRERSPFVGREDSLGWLHSQWSDARDGSGRLAVIAGDPGIGKTRLASELARAAHEEGAAVLLGRCHEELLMSYQPFVEAFARYVAAVSPDVLRGQVDPHGGELARLVPELARRLPDLVEPAGVDAEDERFRLFEAAGALLANASRSWPVVLVLEDLHWADKPTALLLTHLVRAIQAERVLVVGTYRETELGEPLVSVLADLHRERAVERLRLGSLNRGDVATMISGWLGRPPPTHFAHALHRETEGNPFFIEEVLRHLIEADAVEGSEWARLASFTELGIPDGVREAIERRLATLSPAARRVVTMAAAIGRTFSIEVLDTLAEQPGERLLDALEEATERRIVEEEAGALGRYTFAHALIRETLYASLSGPRRVGLHRRIGAILEQQHADDADPPLGELAYHFVAAAEPGAAAKAVDYSARAARRALAALAYEEAVGHFDRALEAVELSNSPDQATRCELLLGLGEARGKASEFDESRAAFQAAAELARTAGLGEHLARAALGLGRGWIEQGSANPAVIGLLEEALAALPEAQTALRARLLGRLAMELHFSDEPERCQALARQAVALARRLGDPSTLASALNAHHWAQRGQDEVGELLAIADQIIEHAEGSEELELALQGHSWRLVDLLEIGQADEIDDEIAACVMLADRLGQPFYRSWVAGLHPMRALMQGRFGDAERLAGEALAAAESAANWNGITASRVQLAWCWKDIGCGADRAAEVERFVREEVLTRPLSGGAAAVWNGNLALFMAEAGLEARARHYLDRVADCDDTELTQNVDGRSGAALAAEACALLGDERLAPRFYELLLPRDGLCILGGRGVYFRGAVARYLGLLAATMGRADDAVRHLEDALETNTRAQAPPWIARSLLDLARALLTRGRPGDGLRAVDRLQRAEPLARNLGMRSLAAQATLERSAINAPSQPRR
jgi:DNA-binding SARP family transcriptional activator/tetratricopeptide (TPR) repeat protein